MTSRCVGASWASPKRGASSRPARTTATNAIRLTVCRRVRFIGRLLPHLLRTCRWAHRNTAQSAEQAALPIARSSDSWRFSPLGEEAGVVCSHFTPPGLRGDSISTHAHRYGGRLHVYFRASHPCSIRWSPHDDNDQDSDLDGRGPDPRQLDQRFCRGCRVHSGLFRQRPVPCDRHHVHHRFEHVGRAACHVFAYLRRVRHRRHQPAWPGRDQGAVAVYADHCPCHHRRYCGPPPLSARGRASR